MLLRAPNTGQSNEADPRAKRSTTRRLVYDCHRHPSIRTLKDHQLQLNRGQNNDTILFRYVESC